MTSIVWFRQDLRIEDNPALHAAAAQGHVLPVYIMDDVMEEEIGGAGRWWLHHSLIALKKQLEQKQLGGLVLLRGNPQELLLKLARDTGATHVFWNRCYAPEAIQRDTKLKADFKQRGVVVQTFNAALLNEPWEIKNGSGEPFKVFTPYWRACLSKEFLPPMPATKVQLAATENLGCHMDELALLPRKPNWAKGWENHWQPGAAGAAKKLDVFLQDGLRGYGDLRNRPDLPHVSRLSPHLHWGEISPRQIVARTQQHVAHYPELLGDKDKFFSELGWREFAHHLLFHYPQLASHNWKPAFDAYPWRNNAQDLVAWQRGQTGYPMVDAGMRELWQTGWMHNRVRMITASFLIKHLQIDWRQGLDWFWDTLVDADTANNAASWQWVAGSGADASPYFRIFNPITQGQKFDPNGAYVRRWCPELASLPNEFIHAPFAAPPEALAHAGIRLGIEYPLPIIDHASAREAAMAGYALVKASGVKAAGNSTYHNLT